MYSFKITLYLQLFKRVAFKMREYLYNFYKILTMPYEIHMKRIHSASRHARKADFFALYIIVDAGQTHSSEGTRLTEKGISADPPSTITPPAITHFLL